MSERTPEHSAHPSDEKPWLWKPGVSANPGGRPAVVKEVRELARAHTARAIERLAAMLDDEDGRVVVAAASALLDRGWGRPEQSIAVDATVTTAVDVDALRAHLAMRVEALTAPRAELPASQATVEASGVQVRQDGRTEGSPESRSAETAVVPSEGGDTKGARRPTEGL